MPRYKLVIQKQSPDYQISVELNEKTKKEAIASSQEVIKDVAEQFAEGFYTGRLYRKLFLLGWCRVSTPVIACNYNTI